MPSDDPREYSESLCGAVKIITVAYLWYQRGTWRERDPTDPDHDVGTDSSRKTD
ncbi:hypothetical protein AArcCO_1622 [Halalkaliarchaeum sp. AArc-CO]|nr:hypothetical protein AArcCO_1622 [Halalkaliarchaeum sp. AArc-CO]